MRQLAPSDPETGAFTRSASGFPAVAGTPSARLHLYVGLPCPWAHRALLVRALLDLEDRLPVSVAVPGDDGAWSFTPGSPDAVYGKRKLREVYAARSGGFEGRATVPMLWDVERREVVCNESVEIAKFLCGLAAEGGLDLWPPELRQDIERWYGLIYPSVNNGVYRQVRLCAEPGSLRRRGERAVRRAGQAGGPPRRLPLPVRRQAHAGRRVPLHHADQVRRRLQPAVPVHQAQAGRVPQPARLHARHLPDAQGRRDLRHGSHHGGVLQDPLPPQPRRDPAPRAGELRPSDTLEAAWQGGLVLCRKADSSSYQLTSVAMTMSSQLNN